MAALTSLSSVQVMVNDEHFSVPESGVHRLSDSHGLHDVFAWRQNSCLLLVGSSKLAVKVCYDRVDVWAHPSLADSLHGLCGHYNFYINDDFTGRSGTVHPLSTWPNADFPMSWRVRPLGCSN